MNRCTKSRAGSAFSAFLASLFLMFLTFAVTASAQGIQRDAPKDVVLGKLVVTAPPEVTLDGKPDRLSPGSRIRDTNNMLVLSGALAGLSVPVVYRRDSAGLVHEAWILTAEEYARLGGVDAGTPDGFIKFLELLNFIFAVRK